MKEEGEEREGGQERKKREIPLISILRYPL